MLKKTFIALAAVSTLGLAACGDDTVEEGDTTIVEGADTTAVDPVESMPAEETGDSVSISEDGMSADINSGDTSISADVDGDPSLTVETN